ncbi:MAG: cupin domain-containing protein [Desulfobacterales bacterium]|nr:cupin domain-containing protein [Desulfobacterales bacterium]MBF0396949.1 cupin domain-containing protein [Desulfobacterales bacterium]
MIRENDIKWLDSYSLPPGAKMAVIEGTVNEAVPFMIRLKFPADYKIPPHCHPAIEHITVLHGTINMGIGEKLDLLKTNELPEGSVMIIQPNTYHFLWTKEESILQLHGVGPWEIAYFNKEEEPMKK